MTFRRAPKITKSDSIVMSVCMSVRPQGTIWFQMRNIKRPRWVGHVAGMRANDCFVDLPLVVFYKY